MAEVAARGRAGRAMEAVGMRKMMRMRMIWTKGAMMMVMMMAMVTMMVMMMVVVMMGGTSGTRERLSGRRDVTEDGTTEMGAE